MLDMSPNEWFPVFTLLLGYGTKAFSDWFQHRRAREREREARDAARRDQLFERRTSFQRQTLLDLQEAIMRLTRTTAEANRKLPFQVDSLKVDFSGRIICSGRSDEEVE